MFTPGPCAADDECLPAVPPTRLLRISRRKKNAPMRRVAIPIPSPGAGKRVRQICYNRDGRPGNASWARRARKTRPSPFRADSAGPPNDSSWPMLLGTLKGACKVQGSRHHHAFASRCGRNFSFWRSVHENARPRAGPVSHEVRNPAIASGDGTRAAQARRKLAPGAQELHRRPQEESRNEARKSAHNDIRQGKETKRKPLIKAIARPSSPANCKNRIGKNRHKASRQAAQ